MKVSSICKNKGRMPSKITRQKMSAASKGKKKTEKHAKNISNGLSKIYEITKPNGDIEIIKNLKTYCAKNNLHYSNMSLVANGKRNIHKGYKCKRLT